MFSMIIVDDEPAICTLIQSLVNWDTLQIKLVGVACSGIEAYDLILKQKPDIVITDIQMPGYDGLEMIERVKASGIETFFVIISGYREFEYAKKALEFKVEEYLLKPIKEVELNQILSKLEKKLLDRTLQQDKENEWESKRVTDIHDKWKYGLQRMLEYPKMSWTDFFSDVCGNLYFAEPQGQYFVGILKGDIKKKVALTEEALQSIMEHIMEIITNSLVVVCDQIETYCDVNQVYFICRHSGKLKESFNNSKKILADVLKYQSLKYGELYLTIALSCEVTGGKAIGTAMQEAKNLIRSRIWNGVDTILTMDKIGAPRFREKAFLKDEDRKSLFRIINNLNAEAINEWVSSVSENYAFGYGGNLEMLDVALDIERVASNVIAGMGLPLGIPEGFSREKFTRRIEDALSLEEIKQVLSDTLSQRVDQILEYKHSIESKPIRIAKEYISKNFGKSISLEEVAEQVYLASAYFSTVFKRETGVNFGEYVLNVRLEAAKHLLETTSLGIADIAYQVGYTDSRHFSKLFIKKEGIRPKEYRKLHT